MRVDIKETLASDSLKRKIQYNMYIHTRINFKRLFLKKSLITGDNKVLAA